VRRKDSSDLFRCVSGAGPIKTDEPCNFPSVRVASKCLGFNPEQLALAEVAQFTKKGKVVAFASAVTSPEKARSSFIKASFIVPAFIVQP